MRQLLIDLVPQCATATPPALLCVRSWAAVLVLAARACAAAPPADEAGVLSSRFDVVLVLT